MRLRLIIPLLIVIVAAGVLLAPEGIENRVAPRATVVSAVGNGRLAPDERAYVDGLQPYLDVLVGEGRALSNLGQARSRNIVELTVRMDRYRTAARDINEYIRDHPAPSGLAEFVGQLQHEITASLTAIDSSIDAIRGFDWDALGRTVNDFSVAIDAIADLAGTPLANPN